MAEWLAQLAPGWLPEGDIQEDIARFLAACGSDPADNHLIRVGAAARRLAERFGADAGQAELAGWLHDISKVIPNSRRLEAALALGLDVLPEEAAFPMILHQKLSVEISRDLFGVRQPAVLSAIGCHTTLKPDATLLDQVVFLADKLAWDGSNESPYMTNLLNGLAHSLKAGVFAYLDYCWQQRHTMSCVHPWMVAAHTQLAAELAQESDLNSDQ